MLDTPIQFRSPEPNATNKTTQPPTLRQDKHPDTTSTTNPMDPQDVSRLVEGTAAYPYQFNPQSILTPLNPQELTPPNSFPSPIPPPSDLPLRIPQTSPKYADLDEVFDAARPHMILGPQGMRQGYNDEEDESRSKHAIRELERHIADRTPYAQFASDRLQAVMGVRNESPFDPPDAGARNRIGPSFQALYNGPDGGRAAKTRTPARNIWRKDSGIGLGLGLGVLSPKMLGMHFIDKDTGKGLREFLLQKGKEQGHKKRVCHGISFHDFTPEIRTLGHRNVLLGHFGAEGSGERIDAYDVDLPTVTVDPETGIEKQTNEPWLWILICRSMVSFDPTSTSTMPVPECPESPESSIPSTPSTNSLNSQSWYTPQTSFTSNTSPQQPPILHPIPPPNFPRPIPLSWLVFAAPLAHITSHPEITESLPMSSVPLPFANSSALIGKAVQKRRDYDFSHAGVPIFEFSSASIFTNNSPALNFLSVSGIGPWHPGDPFTEFSEEEYEVVRARFDAECKAKRNQGKSEAEIVREEVNRCGAFDGDDDDVAEGNNRGIGVQSPNRGVWWKEFYRMMYEDRAKWKGIRQAMGRGKCRVVIRWMEWVGDEGSVDVDRLLDGRGKKRVTRSEARRRSGLAVAENAVIGGGLPTYDSRRATPAHTPAGVSENEIGKARYR